MKKLSKIILLLILPFSFLITNNSFAGDPIIVTVTEEIPGANCTGIGSNPGDGGECYEGDAGCKGIKYECEVEPGFGSITSMMGAIIKYFTYLAGLGAVLFIVVNGILYSMSGMDAGMKDEAKKRISKTLIGLILLLLSGVILNIVAPWVYV